MSFNPVRWQVRAPAELGRKLARLAALVGMRPDAYLRSLVAKEPEPDEAPIRHDELKP